MIVVAVIPFLNEERHLVAMLDSVQSQTRPPDRLLLVDDGSTDRSADVAAHFARRHDYATLLSRPPRPVQRDRLATAAEWQAFQWAVEMIATGFDVVAKLDADILLSPDVVAEVERSFVTDPKLGIAGPYLAETGACGRLVRMRGRCEHVHGATKFYRRECYQEILPLPAVHGWDMVDEVKARSRGWRTLSLDMPEGDSLHLRPMGTHDGALRGFRRWGQGDYMSGTHPLIVLVVAFHRLRDRPRLVGSANYLFGWAAAALMRIPRIEPDLRNLACQEQLGRVRARLTRWARAGNRPA